MNADLKVAEQFGNFISKGDYAAAHSLLTNDVQKSHSPDGLKASFEGMIAYAKGPILEVGVMEDFISYNWPGKEEGDVASVYVSLLGANYAEAVSVVLTKESGIVRIRHLEWGRP